MKQVVIKNFWLKVLALFLAVIVWLYVVGELNKGTPEEKELFDRMIPYRLMTKSIPIKVAVIGKPRPGYRILNEEIIIKPSNCLVVASQSLLKNVSYLTTEDIDISEFTRSVVKDIKIKPIAGGALLEKDFFVKVVIPVKRIEEGKEVKK